MFVLRAPYPGVQTTSLLPNPQLSDQESLTDTVLTRRAMDGTLRTLVKTTDGRKKLHWTFRLDRPKALELRAFLFAYFSQQMELIDHRARTWHGYLTNNPFEFDTTNRAAPGCVASVAAEKQSITLEFEGVEV